MLFTSHDGKQIFVREWTRVENPIGVVQIVHGMNEYVARYEKFAQRLNECGYIVVGDDHRGHGDTDPDTLGYAPGDMFGDTLKDEAKIAEYYRSKYPDCKYIVFGFSYGSFITQAFVEHYNSLADGAIIAGSSRQSGVAVRAGKFLSDLFGLFRGNDSPANAINSIVFGGYDKKIGEGEFQWLSTNRESNAAYMEDPYCRYVCSYNFFQSFFRWLCGLYQNKNAKMLDRALPLLLISGSDDPVGGEKGVSRLYDFYRKEDVQRVEKHMIGGGRHEFLNEPDHFEEAFSVILKFVESCPKRKK